MTVEEIRKALKAKAPVVITESGEIVEPGREGQEIQRLVMARWY